MSVIFSKENYLDNDLAYLMGMVLMRGTFHIERDIRRLIIQFPYKSLELKTLSGSKLKIDKKSAIQLSLDQTRNRFHELLGVDVKLVSSKNEIQLDGLKFISNPVILLPLFLI